MGLAVAVPVGPISLLCIHRTIISGRLGGLASGIGAATADAIYAAVAILSLEFASNLIIHYQLWSRLIGGMAICLIGLHIFISKTYETKGRMDGKNILNACISTFFLTIANPATVLFFMAAFTGLGVTRIKDNELGIVLVVSGTFLGSSIWWLVLSVGTDLLMDRAISRLNLLTRVMGVLIFFIGLYAVLFSLIQSNLL